MEQLFLSTGPDHSGAYLHPNQTATKFNNFFAKIGYGKRCHTLTHQSYKLTEVTNIILNNLLPPQKKLNVMALIAFTYHP